ncbi:hypothetical protein B0O80DRAFT_45689 [Mortierella sp. GBAus27b]|nr:hypothetical protein B0O80DRAFT_45689 [Mortierella sp. GBAus27b]
MGGVALNVVSPRRIHLGQVVVVPESRKRRWAKVRLQHVAGFACRRFASHTLKSAFFTSSPSFSSFLISHRPLLPRSSTPIFSILIAYIPSWLTRDTTEHSLLNTHRLPHPTASLHTLLRDILSSPTPSSHILISHTLRVPHPQVLTTPNNHNQPSLSTSKPHHLKRTMTCALDGKSVILSMIPQPSPPQPRHSCAVCVQGDFTLIGPGPAVPFRRIDCQADTGKKWRWRNAMYPSYMHSHGIPSLSWLTVD